ncbi:MobQ family relaxase [Bacillus haynesii]|nr:MobQ family relaxase [Bacillus haynesii]MEC0736887.1 MobQ family relaxase [Bacillus haynesii]
MAIYHFSGQMLSKVTKEGKPKSPLACAAYRSGEMLKDDSTGDKFYYEREVKPVTHILAPKHAPEWVHNREKLWNEVNKIEKNYNAQFAREFNVALPKELSNEEQEELAIEYCQEAFVDKGMVADIAIHRDDENNPHFHVMLTVRPFNQDGTWGMKSKREYKFDENGNHILKKNGQKDFFKVDLTDWNQKETFNGWRKLWAEKTNKYLSKNNIDQKISHLSNEDRGLEKLPTIHEGYVARKMSKKGLKSERIEHNKEVKKYNGIVSELNKYKQKKEQYQYQQNFSRKFSPSEKKQLSSIAKELKMFVDYDSILNRQMQLEKWNKSLVFTKDSQDKMAKMSRINKEKDLLNEALSILKVESDRFLKSYYPTWDIDSLSESEKFEIVDRTINYKRVLNEDEIIEIEDEVVHDNLVREVNAVLHNRYAFVMNVDKQIDKISNFKSIIEKQLGISDRSNPSVLKEAALRNPVDFKNLKNAVNALDKLMESKKLMNDLYDMELRKLYPNAPKGLRLEEKEFLIVGYEYYKQPIDKKVISDLKRYNPAEQSQIIRILTSKSNNLNKRQELKNKFPDFQFSNPRYLLFFKDECLRNINKLSKEDIGLLKQIHPEEFAEVEMNKSDFVKSVNRSIDQSIAAHNEVRTNVNYEEMQNENPASVLIGSLDQMLNEMTKDRSFDSKKQFEEDLQRKSKKRNVHRGGGHSL